MFKRLLKEYIADIVFLAVCVFISYTFLSSFAILHIVGNSMYPTYEDKDIAIVKKVKAPKKGNLAIFTTSSSWESAGDKLIKRIIAVEGDKVSIDEENVVVNGDKIKHDKPHCEGIHENTFIVEENEYIMLGDNYQLSNDSVTQYCYGNEDYSIAEENIEITGKELFTLGGLFK